MHGQNTLKPSATLIYRRALDGLPWWITATLLFGLGLVLARLTWTLTYPDASVTAAAGSHERPAADHRPGVDQATTLAELSLFGEEKTAQAAPEVRESSLAIRLRGVITGPAPFAIIDRPGGVELRQTGETIGDEVVIHAIEPDRIIVDNAGRLESIDLPGAGRATLNQPALAPGAGAEPPSLSELMDAPERLFELINVAAVRRDGRVIGYRVNSRPGRERLLRQVGLVDGDVITHVANEPLSDPGNLAHLMDRLNQGGRIAIRVEREGESIETMVDTGVFQ